jgi:GT2 family glycosyltransferase
MSPAHLPAGGRARAMEGQRGAVRASSPHAPGVTVAIPVRDGGDPLARTLAALARQTVAHELLVCDSGSTDGSPASARAHGARVIEIAPREFSHGGTRNLLLREAAGERVALLTQDSEPADERWLERLLEGFALAEDVGIVYGPYIPRPGASPAVRLELEGWFASLSPDGRPRVERLRADERTLPAVELMGARGFFTDANACLSRAAWSQAPFREVPYAEDRVLAIDMLRAGYSKAFVPAAAVLHSHDYTAGEQLRRCFDEWRGLREVYGWREPASPAHLAGQLRGALGQARRELIRADAPALRRRATLAAVSRHHVLRLAGALLGSRAERLPPGARRRLSLEGRAGFSPLDLDNSSPRDLRSARAPLQDDDLAT